MNAAAHFESVGRLELLATAIARRSLKVEPAAFGEPTWTDGKVVFVDVRKHVSEQVVSLAVQASLVSAGSLDGDVMRGLARRPALTGRYLAVEGHRALATVEHLLPRSVRSLIRNDVARLSSSPAASLAVARSGARDVELPDSFGTIVPKRLLASLRADAAPAAQRSLVELADDATLAEEAASTDILPTELGRGGPLGKLLSKLFSATRRLGGGGSPGGDAPTHWTRSGVRRGQVVFSSNAPSSARDLDPSERTHGLHYPEWDVHTHSYRSDWCTVLETPPAVQPAAASFTPPDHAGLRRALARVTRAFEREGRQRQGDDLDVDALVQAQVEILAGASPDESFFIDSVRRRRNLSVLVLLDISGSAAEPSTHGPTVHEQQRSAAAALMLALHALGDRVALYAYHSQGRNAVHVMPVKRFAEQPGAHVMSRLKSLSPGAYSRLGAATRHGTTVLREQGGTPRQLLVVVSDGLAYDHGYEPAYGAADARRALAEARNQGVGCLCLSVGASTDADALRRVFGASAHAALNRPEQLTHVIAPLFRSALRSADIRRRLSAAR